MMQKELRMKNRRLEAKLNTAKRMIAVLSKKLEREREEHEITLEALREAEAELMEAS